MKRHFLQLLLFAFLLTALPLLPALLIRPAAVPEPAERIAATESTFSTTEPPAVENQAGYRILQTATGEIREVPLREYLIGAVGAEMPASFAPETLKAQAVAAHTYAERQCMLSAGREELQGADFSDDPSLYQACLTEDEQRERWGTQYALYHERIAAAVDAVQEELLYYDGAPIIAAFHAMSSGRTESAAHVWGSEIPYLCSVESEADCSAPEFETTVQLTAGEVRERLLGAHTGLTLGKDPAGWFGEPAVSEAGTVLQLQAGDGIFTGQELRSILGLRSAAFTAEYADGQFTFTVHGFGHDVGMSQYGANAMALEGHSYQEILAYYYPGAELRPMTAEKPQ
ncbi:MAG: stage II sporulation protein D [Oscillospiraceae bacterium]|nr:stage II sporulation protein D [Oscillospiraceae bacterium]